MRKPGFKHSPETIAKLRLNAGRPKGSVQSQQEKDRRAESLRGRKNSPETIERMRASAQERAARGISEETRIRMSEAQRNRFIDKPLPEESRKKISVALTGVPKTREHAMKVGAAHAGRIKGPMPESTREKIRQASRSNAEVYCGRMHHSFGRIPPHVRKIEYNGRTYRSSYEVRFAKMLDRQRIQFEYEPRTFDLGDTTYTPDFLLIDYEMWCEVKGWMTDKAEEKLRRFRELYPLEQITVVPKSFFIQNRDLSLGA